MSETFRPLGERARWRVIYDLFRAAEIGDTVTYADMAGPLNLDPEEDRHTIQMAARRAGLELERIEQRSADAVKGKGYRIVQPEELLGLGQRRNRRAGRQIRRGATIAEAGLATIDDPTIRNAMETLAQGFAVQAEINRRVASKQQQHDDLIAELMNRVDRLERR